MPFRPCYRRVGCLLDPDLCCSCVGRSSPGQPSRLPRTRRCHTGTRARPRLSTPAIFHPMPAAARRPAAAGYRWPASHPVTPSARPGMTHREEQSMRRRIKSTHIAERGSPLNRSNAGQPCAGVGPADRLLRSVTSANVGRRGGRTPVKWRPTLSLPNMFGTALAPSAPRPGADRPVRLGLKSGGTAAATVRDSAG
jgi:hypothetical protein